MQRRCRRGFQIVGCDIADKTDHSRECGEILDMLGQTLGLAALPDKDDYPVVVLPHHTLLVLRVAVRERNSGGPAYRDISSVRAWRSTLPHRIAWPLAKPCLGASTPGYFPASEMVDGQLPLCGPCGPLCGVGIT